MYGTWSQWSGIVKPVIVRRFLMMFSQFGPGDGVTVL